MSVSPPYPNHWQKPSVYFKQFTVAAPAACSHSDCGNCVKDTPNHCKWCTASNTCEVDTTGAPATCAAASDGTSLLLTTQHQCEAAGPATINSKKGNEPTYKTYVIGQDLTMNVNVTATKIVSTAMIQVTLVRNAQPSTGTQCRRRTEGESSNNYDDKTIDFYSDRMMDEPAYYLRSSKKRLLDFSSGFSSSWNAPSPTPISSSGFSSSFNGPSPTPMSSAGFSSSWNGPSPTPISSSSGSSSSYYDFFDATANECEDEEYNFGNYVLSDLTDGAGVDLVFPSGLSRAQDYAIKFQLVTDKSVFGYTRINPLTKGSFGIAPPCFVLEVEIDLRTEVSSRAFALTQELQHIQL